MSEHVVTQIAQPAADDAHRLRADHVLELVDLVVQGVDEVEEALRDQIDEVVDVHADVLVLAAGVLRRLRDRTPARPGGVFEIVTKTSSVATKSISW